MKAFVTAALLSLTAFLLSPQQAVAFSAAPTVTVTVEGAHYRFTEKDIIRTESEEELLAGNLERRGAFFTAHKPLKRGSYRIENLYGKIREIALRHGYEPVNALPYFDASKRSFSVASPSRQGFFPDIAAACKQISESLACGKSASVTLTPTLTSPEIDEKKLKQSFFLRASFSTPIYSTDENRKSNVALALRSVNGLTLAPNEEVSFNTLTGERTQANGYLPAKIIADGDFTLGVGGGVCQCSTTLYNALLLADVKVCERRGHSLAVSYVAPGFDATVSQYTADLRFVNDTGNYLYFAAEIAGDRACVAIYGEPLSYEVRRRYEKIKELPPPKEAIVENEEYSHLVTYRDEIYVYLPSTGGCTVQAWLDYLKEGKIIKSKYLHTDTYRPRRGKAVQGKTDR
ncbi:MAG: VanW family protein [Clostridia bacterium]|nr:VanW family protein [Clostridia bacterium]